MEQQVLTALLAMGVPYVTDVLKRAYSLLDTNPSATVSHIKPIISGIALNYLANKTGMPVPPDLVHLTQDPTVNLLSTGVLYGAVGHWLSGLSAALKTHIPSATVIGKLLSIFIGKY